MATQEVDGVFDTSSVPKHCPGPANETAGKSSACQGCPNQQICASGPVVDPSLKEIMNRMIDVKHKILVLSGKGGVGKSTLSNLLARALAMKTENGGKEVQVGLLDIDICGPSQPKMSGLEESSVHQSMEGWSPVYVEENLSLMSIGFLLESLDEAVVWRGPRKNGIIKQFLKDVDWGKLDYLIIDTPPGTSDEHLSIVQYLNEARVDGAVVITTPQEVALMDVRKEIKFCHKLNIPILGVIENMSQFICPKCSKSSEILWPSTGGAAQLCSDYSVTHLGSVPLDPRVGKSCDEGANFLREYLESPLTNLLFQITEKLVYTLRKNENVSDN